MKFINNSNDKLLPSNLKVLYNNQGCVVEKKLNIILKFTIN